MSWVYLFYYERYYYFSFSHVTPHLLWSHLKAGRNTHSYTKRVGGVCLERDKHNDACVFEQVGWFRLGWGTFFCVSVCVCVCFVLTGVPSLPSALLQMNQELNNEQFVWMYFLVNTQILYCCYSNKRGHHCWLHQCTVSQNQTSCFFY